MKHLLATLSLGLVAVLCQAQSDEEIQWAIGQAMNAARPEVRLVLQRPDARPLASIDVATFKSFAQGFQPAFEAFVAELLSLKTAMEAAGETVKPQILRRFQQGPLASFQKKCDQALDRLGPASKKRLAQINIWWNLPAFLASDELAEYLGLTPNQRRGIQKALAAYSTGRDAVRSPDAFDPTDKSDIERVAKEDQRLFKALDHDFLSLLTPSQKRAIDDLRGPICIDPRLHHQGDRP